VSSELVERVDSILERAAMPDRHSYFQIRKFIIGKECTVQGQMWQIVRELQARKETVESLTKQLEDAADNVDLIDIKIQRQKLVEENAPKFGLNKEDEALNIKEAQINTRKLEREKEHLLKSIEKVRQKVKCTQEESRYFLLAFEELEKIEELKPLDDSEAQAEFWSEKLLEEFNLRVLLNNPLDSELVKTIMSLDKEAPVRKHVTAMMKNLQDQMAMQNKAAVERLEEKKKQVTPNAKIKAS